TVNLATHLKAEGQSALADVAYTLQMGRKAFEHRWAVVCAEVPQAITALETGQGLSEGVCEDKAPRLIFMFSGQGAQSVNMGRELYRHEPLFREQVDKCCEILRPHLGLDLRQVLYPEHPSSQVADQLKQTALAQPALFVLEYALGRLWMSWGLE